MSDLDRLYTDLTTACGVSRIRDTRLEQIAMDRALEARFTVGTEGALGIPHPTNQLIARTYPHRAHTPHSVHENAVWNYTDDWQDDFVPQVVEAWMNSASHLANLERQTDTHWGIGYHVEPPTGMQQNNRYYVIAVFSEALINIPTRTLTLPAGFTVGKQYSATATIDSLAVTLTAPTAFKYDLSSFIAPQKRNRYHLVTGPLKNYWVNPGAVEST